MEKQLLVLFLIIEEYFSKATRGQAQVFVIHLRGGSNVVIIEITLPRGILNTISVFEFLSRHTMTLNCMSVLSIFN
jgi:hypothetical protein